MAEVATKKRKLALPIETQSYLVIDGKVFYIEKTKENPNDIQKKLHDFYQAEYNRIKQEAITAWKANVDSEFQRSVEHISKFQARASVSVPPEMYGKSMLYDNGNKTFYYTTPIIYNPLYFVGSYSTVMSTLGISEFDEDSPFVKLNGTMSSTKVYVKLKAAPQHACLVGFDPKGNKIKIFGLRTFHCMSNYMCIGENDAKKYFNVSQLTLQQQVSTTNLFSLAPNGGAKINDTIYETRHLLKLSNVELIEKGKGESKWKL